MIRLANGSDGLAISDNTMEHIAMHGRDSNDHEAPMPTGPTNVCILSMGYWSHSAPSWRLGNPLAFACSLSAGSRQLLLYFYCCLCTKESRKWSAWRGIHIHTWFAFFMGPRDGRIGSGLDFLYLSIRGKKHWRSGLWGRRRPRAPRVAMYAGHRKGASEGFTEGEAVLTDH